MHLKEIYNLGDFSTKIDELDIQVHKNVTLKVLKFESEERNFNPAIIFIAGWISIIESWKKVLKELTKDFTVYYVETREKISSKVIGKVKYGVEELGLDIVEIVERLGLKDDQFILFGSSLGATAILDCCRYLRSQPKCLVLIGPNANFRVPKLGMLIIILFHPAFYLLIKPITKWYLKHFRLDVKSDKEQYLKYCRALDAADPWKLKKAVLELSKYQVWNRLSDIKFNSLFFNASKDVMHVPENINKMVEAMEHAVMVDMETNDRTHSKDMVNELRKYLEKL